MKDLKYYFNKAVKQHFALGAFNFSNMEGLQGVANACKKLKSPAIISVSEGALEYMSPEITIAMANAVKKTCPYLFLHLDHGKSYEICKKAVDIGFDSVMIDGSSLSFKENIALTKKVANYAHKKGVLVEGELGQLKGVEDNVSSEENHYTEPLKAKEFVEKTGIDSLAVAIGTSHGAYKYQGKQTLRFDILAEIEKLLPSFPLVLHGASCVDKKLVDKINAFGGDIKNAQGVPPKLLCKAVKEHNVVKINSDTDLRLAMTAEVRQVLQGKRGEFDARKYVGKGRTAIEEVVADKIKNTLFSDNKA